jgi:hypothetical protein
MFINKIHLLGIRLNHDKLMEVKKMKRIIGLFMALIVMSVAVAAAGQGDSGAGKDAVPTLYGQDGKGNMSQSGDTVMSQERVQAKIENTEQLRIMVQQRQQAMEQEMAGMGRAEGEVYKNQNKVRMAVHALKGMENLVGNKGQQISAVAKEFNNSVQATIRAEEMIQKRNALARLFAGGDAESAEEIEKQVEQNRNRIQELKQLRDECDCDNEVRQMMQEQIQNMEQEQNRLEQLAQNEKKSKGLLGWIWK